MMSQAISALTATAASKGEPMATTPNMISRTPQRIDHPEACFSSEFVDCATMCASSVRLQDGTFCSQGAIYASRIRSGFGRNSGVLLGHPRSGNDKIFAVACVQTLAFDGLLLSRDCLQALAVKLEKMSGVLFRM